MFALGGMRATAVAARTMHRELKAAGYDRAEMLRFANAFLESVLEESSAGEGEAVDRAMTCPETGLMLGKAFEEAVEFERLRCSKHPEYRLLVFRLDVRLGRELPAGEHKSLHVAVTRALEACLRSGNVLGKPGRETYVFVLSQTPPEPQVIAARVCSRLAAEREIVEWIRLGALQFELRHTYGEPSDVSTGEVLERLEQVTPSPLEVRPPEAAGAEASGGRATPRSQQPLTLVLCGGASRAIAHVGALRALVGAGYQIGGIVGTSASALIGAMFSRGMSPDEILRRFTEVSRGALVRKMRRAFAASRARAPRSKRSLPPNYLAVVSDEHSHAASVEDYAAFIESLVGRDVEMSQLPIPFATCAADLVEGRSVVLTHGSLHAALRGTFALPGLFPPEPYGDRLLVDGAALSEAPLAAAHSLAGDRPTLVLYLRRPLHRLTDFPTSRDVVVRLNSLVHRELVREQLRSATALVALPVEEYGFLEVGHLAEIAAVGESTLSLRLDELRKALDRSLDQGGTQLGGLDPQR